MQCTASLSLKDRPQCSKPCLLLALCPPATVFTLYPQPFSNLPAPSPPLPPAPPITQQPPLHTIVTATPVMTPAATSPPPHIIKHPNILSLSAIASPRVLPIIRKVLPINPRVLPTSTHFPHSKPRHLLRSSPVCPGIAQGTVQGSLVLLSVLTENPHFVRIKSKSLKALPNSLSFITAISAK